MLRGSRDRKVTSTYKRLNPNELQRIYTVLAPDTASFRLSSGDSLLDKKHTTNLQNMEKKVAKLDPLYQVRDIFIPDDGYELVACDYSNAEAIGCAAYSQDWTYLDKILAGLDVHVELARFMFETPDCTPLQRDIAKTIRYASQYAAKVPTITLNLNKEADTTGMYFMQEQVFQYHKKLLLMHPLERWWDQTTRALEQQNNVLYNCFGYRRTFHDPDAHNRLKDALSFLPQSTVAWLMNQALPPIHQWVTQQGGYIQLLLQIHDEFLFQATPDAIEALVQKVTPLLEVSFTVSGHSLHIPVEFKRGLSWGSMKKFDHKRML